MCVSDFEITTTHRTGIWWHVTIRYTHFCRCWFWKWNLLSARLAFHTRQSFNQLFCRSYRALSSHPTTSIHDSTLRSPSTIAEKSWHVSILTTTSCLGRLLCHISHKDSYSGTHKSREKKICHAAKIFHQVWGTKRPIFVCEWITETFCCSLRHWVFKDHSDEIWF